MLHDSLMASTRAQVLYTGQKFPIGKNAPYGNRSHGNNVYPPCAKALGIKHEALNQSTGERVRGAIHIQTVNNRHSEIKGFLRHYRGVSSKYLGNYLRWYGRSDLLKSSPRSYLAVAIEGPPTRFAN